MAANTEELDSKVIPTSATFPCHLNRIFQKKMLIEIIREKAIIDIAKTTIITPGMFYRTFQLYHFSPQSFQVFVLHFKKPS
jgi:hypothetical protein